jgi:hypothetical protein
LSQADRDDEMGEHEALMRNQPHPELLPPVFLPAPDQPGDDDDNEEKE